MKIYIISCAGAYVENDWEKIGLVGNRKFIRSSGTQLVTRHIPFFIVHSVAQLIILEKKQ